MKLLNINTIFCEEFEKETASYKGVFIVKQYEDIPENGFEVALLISRAEDIKLRAIFVLCKTGSDGKVDDILLLSEFKIPEKEESSINMTEFFIKHIGKDRVEKKGKYNVIVLVKEDNGESEDNEMDLNDYDIVENSGFEII